MTGTDRQRKKEGASYKNIINKQMQNKPNTHTNEKIQQASKNKLKQRCMEQAVNTICNSFQFRIDRQIRSIFF